MNKRSKQLLSGLLIFCLAVFAAGCAGGGAGAPGGTGAPPPESEAAAPGPDSGGGEIENIRFMAASAGGEWYPIAVAISEGWKEIGISSTVLPGGGASNVLGLAQDKGDVGFTFSVTAVDGIEGNEPFEQPLEGYKALCCLTSSYVQPVVYEDSGINSIADLKGKRINVYTKGYTSELNARLVLKAYGLTYDDMKGVDYLSDDDAIDQLKDGHLDCTISTGSIPDAGFIDMASVRPLKVLEMEPEMIETATGLNAGLYPAVIPAGTYDIPQDVNTLGTKLMLIARGDLPVEVVYELTRGIHNSLETLYNVNSNLREVTIETMASDCGIDYHPGAVSYYQEHGAL